MNPQLEQALKAAQTIALLIATNLNERGYGGPLAVAGGYVRDMALGRDPKDCDLWLDGGMIPMNTGEALAIKLCKFLGPEWKLDKKLNSYGTWSKDIDYVCKLSGPPIAVMNGVDLPAEIDFIVLNRRSLMAAGYVPQVFLGPSTHSSFLSAVLARVDLRLNAIGATSEGSARHALWDADVEAQRLVVQQERVDDDMRRIDKRLDRLGHGKFDGWTSWHELEDGTLKEVVPLVE